MKNKVIVYIAIVYLVLMAIILVTQIPKYEEELPLIVFEDFNVENKLEKAVVMHVDSPLAIVHERQIIINNDDINVAPTMQNDTIYIPIDILRDVFGAAVDWQNHDKETTLRYNNKAVIFRNNSNKVRLVDNLTDVTEDKEISSTIIKDRTYIPIEFVAEIFDKETFLYDDLIVLSDIKDIFDDEEDKETLDELVLKVSGLPMIANKKHLIELISERHTVLETLFSGNVKEKVSDTIGLSAFEHLRDDDKPKEIIVKDEENIYRGIDNFIYFDSEVNFIAENDNEGKVDEESNSHISERDLAEADDNDENVEETLKQDWITLEEGLEVEGLYVYNSNNLVIVADAEEDFRIFIYNIYDKEAPELLREIHIEGSCMGFSISDDGECLYFASKADANSLYKTDDFVSPYLFDSNRKENTYMPLNFANTYYLPDKNNADFLNMFILDLNIYESLEIQSFLGCGKDIYLFGNNLYFFNMYSGGANLHKFNYSYQGITYENYVNMNINFSDEVYIYEYEENLIVFVANEENFRVYFIDKEMQILDFLETDAFELDEIYLENEFLYVSNTNNSNLLLKINFNDNKIKIEDTIELRIENVFKEDEKIEIEDVFDNLKETKSTEDQQ